MKQSVRARIIAVCISVLVVAGVFAGETEVSVLEGRIRVETDMGAIEVPAGHRGILTEGRDPTATVDHPLVRDLIQMDGWLEEEKKAGRIPFEWSTIQVVSMDHEDSWIFLALGEVPAAGLHSFLPAS